MASGSEAGRRAPAGFERSVSAPSASIERRSSMGSSDKLLMQALSSAQTRARTLENSMQAMFTDIDEAAVHCSASVEHARKALASAEATLFNQLRDVEEKYPQMRDQDEMTALVQQCRIVCSMRMQLVAQIENALKPVLEKRTSALSEASLTATMETRGDAVHTKEPERAGTSATNVSSSQFYPASSAEGLQSSEMSSYVIDFTMEGDSSEATSSANDKPADDSELDAARVAESCALDGGSVLALVASRANAEERAVRCERKLLEAQSSIQEVEDELGRSRASCASARMTSLYLLAKCNEIHKEVEKLRAKRKTSKVKMNEQKEIIQSLRNEIEMLRRNTSGSLRAARKSGDEFAAHSWRAWLESIVDAASTALDGILLWIRSLYSTNYNEKSRRKHRRRTSRAAKTVMNTSLSEHEREQSGPGAQPELVSSDSDHSEDGSSTSSTVIVRDGPDPVPAQELC